MLRLVLKILLACAFLFFIFRAVDVSKVIYIMRDQNSVLLIWPVCSVPVWIFLKTLKWHILLRTYLKDIPFFHVIRSLLSGLAIGMMTPGKVGELSRSLFLPAENRSRVAGLTILDRYLELLALLFLASFGVARFFGVIWGLLMCLSGLVGVGMLFLSRRLIERARFAKRSHFLVDKLREMLKAAEGISWTVFMQSFVLSMAVFFISILTSYSLLLSFTHIPFSVSLNVFPLSLMTNILPITLGNLGVREGATILLLNHYGVAKEVSLNISLSLFVLHSLVPSLVGITLMQWGSTRRKRSRPHSSVKTG